MRGRDVAERLGVPFFDLRDDFGPERWDAIILVKYFRKEAKRVRAACDLLIHDALDVFTQTKPLADPVDFWRWCQRQTGADMLVATSPACERLMQDAGATTLYAPHHADLRISRDWYSESGPVVYAGGERFLGDQHEAIMRACKRRGREFVTRFCREGWLALQGASRRRIRRHLDRPTPEPAADPRPGGRTAVCGAVRPDAVRFVSAWPVWFGKCWHDR